MVKVGKKQAPVHHTNRGLFICPCHENWKKHQMQFVVISSSVTRVPWHFPIKSITGVLGKFVSGPVDLALWNRPQHMVFFDIGSPIRVVFSHPFQ